MSIRRIKVENLRSMQARTRVFVFGQRVMALACGLAAGFVVVAWAMPQKRVLDELENALADAHARESEILAEREFHEIELNALRNDPSFLEIHARDRLGYYRDGERVLKFR